MARLALLSQASESLSRGDLLWECDPSLIPALQNIVDEAAFAGTGARIVLASPQGDLQTVASGRGSRRPWRIPGLTVLEQGEPHIEPGLAVVPLRGVSALRGAFLLHYDWSYAASQHEYAALAGAYGSNVDTALQAAMSRLHATQDAAEAMMQMMAMHHPATARHSFIVRKLALILGAALRLPGQELFSLGLAALLHDVGKVCVPAPVLDKDTVLTPHEWALIRSHPAVADRMLRTVTNLSHVAPAVRYHHERWDGGGYPDRLSGEAIPLHARLIGLADSYEAMRTGRAYQAPRNPDDVLLELRRSMGTQFDPGFMALLPEFSRYEVTL